jgi:hypothetical protein
MPLQKTLSKAEQNAAAARAKYASMTISEILAGIITRLLILMMVTLIVVILMFVSPISDRLLTVVLLFFVLAEMEVEYALWFFTYRLGRKTEAPLMDLEEFSVITKEGWRRAEIFLDLTTPFFKWLEEVRERLFPDWRKPKETATPNAPVQPITGQDIVEGLKALAQGIETLNQRVGKLEDFDKDSHMRGNTEQPKRVQWGTEGLK